jgi:hypothetical protein
MSPLNSIPGGGKKGREEGRERGREGGRLIGNSNESWMTYWTTLICNNYIILNVKEKFPEIPSWRSDY